MAQPPTAEDARTLDTMLARVGLAVPTDWYAGVLAGYRELTAMAALMRQPRDAAAEPAIVFDLAAVLGDR
jgi:hypothetical protein